MIDFFNEDIAFPDLDLQRTRTWVSRIILMHQKQEGDLTFIFCSDKYMIEINRQYLLHDYFTDIITFNYNSSDILSGDVFISIDTVTRNASEYEVSFINELHRVIIHGVLHLIGFDDKTEEQQRVMREKEDQALNIFQF